MAATLHACWLGRVPYGQAHDLQQRLVAARQRGEVPDTLLLLEHLPVVTLGRGAHAEHLLLSTEALRARGFEVHEVGRGGDVTYHGPGQLVAYPIVELPEARRDVRRYVATLEETMIRLCARHGLRAGRLPRFNGCWLGVDEDEPGPPRKVGAVGVRISRWVTMHGFAFNVAPDLSHFGLIVPCGIPDKPVTSLQREGVETLPTVREEADAAAEILAELLDLRLHWTLAPPLPLGSSMEPRSGSEPPSRVLG